ncbi:DUF4962 domain-containing protein [Planctomycetales bacterium ZRK34]|nr:DUF4962 domain-containing protein [Planctomycetales bacterium ZRK34]
MTGLRADQPATWQNLPAGDQLIKMVRPDHPRLYIDAAGFDTLKKRVADEPVMARMAEQLIARAEDLLDDAPVTYRIPDGKRLLAVSRRVVGRVFDLAMAYRLTGEARYRDRLFVEMKTVAEFKDWNPSHYLDTAEMTHGVAIAYDWLYNDWTDEQRAVIREAIIRHGLTPGLKCYRGEERYGWWVRSQHNWNQVCNSGMTFGALALADEKPEMAGEILHDAIVSTPLAMKHFAPDGGWGEGVSYWHYAVRYNVGMIAALDTAMGTDFGLADIEGFDHAGWFPIYMTGTVGTFNFADAGMGRVVNAPSLFWFANRFNQPLFASYQQLHQTAQARDMIWYPPDGASKDLDHMPRDKHFRGIDFVSMRSGWDHDSVCVGFKGGSNAVNHSHLDLGSFILDAHGERWINDLGADNYNLPSYFGRGRWNYYRLRAEGHNTLVIAPDNKADQNPKATAPITRFKSGDDHALAIVDLTPAYAPRVKQAKRGLMLMNQRRSVLVQDEVECEKPTQVLWFMHTPAKVALDEARRIATLNQHDKQIRVKLLEPAGATFEVRDAVPLATSPNPQGQKTNHERKLTVQLDNISTARIIVLIETAEPAGDAPKLKPLADW